MPADAVLRALRHLWLTLKPLDIPAAVMGGIAMAAWKYVRATKDVDLLISLGGDESNELLRSLRAADIRLKTERPITSLGHLAVIQLVYQPPETFLDIQIDLLLGNSPYHRRALQRRVSTQLSDLDVQIDVLACEDLILHKLLAGRIIDRADAATLLRANRDALDLDYLLRWVKGLELSSELTGVWNEALPGEPCPVE